MQRMDVTHLESLQPTLSRLNRRLSRLSAARAGSILMIAGSLLAALPNPVTADSGINKILTASPALTAIVAQSNASTPLRLEFTKLRCVDEDGDWGDSTEPYLVVFAADISGPVVRARTVRSPVFGDVDEGETHFMNPPMQLWDFDGTGSPIADPEKLIFLAALVESDDGSSRADAVRNNVQSQLFANLIAYKAGGLSRSSIVSNLIFDMNVAIEQSRDGDDKIGGATELHLTQSDVTNARNGIQVTKTLTHWKSGADYRTTFTLD